MTMTIALAFALVQDKPSPEAEKILKEKAELLRQCPKFFAEFVRIEAGGGIALVREGEKDERVWKVDADAEIRTDGWWGRLEDLAPGDRVWAWARLDREKKPASLMMVADEISEQDIHQRPWTWASIDDSKREIVVKREKETRTLGYRGEAPKQGGGELYLQTAGFRQARGWEVRRLLLGAAEFESARDARKAKLREIWKREGLPGTVGFAHAVSGEVEIMLDHEAQRWGRALKEGTLVQVMVERPIPALVHAVAPFHERTRLTLAATGREFAELRGGKRVRVLAPEPAEDAASSKLPSDADRPRDKARRMDWILSSMYCNCTIAGDGCTGMFYTLASCNPRTCGMPKRVRELAAPMVDRGAADREIFESIEKALGPGIFKSHLLR